MKAEKHPEEKHAWVCIQTSGMLSEIKKTFPLSASQIDMVEADLSKAPLVCPGGEIACSGCDAKLIPSPEATVDYASLKAKIINPSAKPQ